MSAEIINLAMKKRERAFVQLARRIRSGKPLVIPSRIQMPEGYPLRGYYYSWQRHALEIILADKR